MTRAGFTYRQRNTRREFVGIQLKHKEASETEYTSTRF
jgi:hypothetical protein